MATRIGRIEREFILRELRNAAAPVELETIAGTVGSRLLDYQESSFRFSLPQDAPELLTGNALTVRFSYHEQSYAFAARVVRVYHDSVEVSSSEDWAIGLSRSYARRSLPEDLSVSFGVQGKRYELDYPRLRDAIAAQVPDEQKADIRGIVESIREWADSLKARGAVSVFRGREPSGLQETLVVRTGKAFYLPSPAMGIPAIDPSPRPDMGIVTWQEVLDYYARSVCGPDHAEFEAKKFLRDRYAEGIQSELVVPVRFQDYVVGILSLHSRTPATSGFDLAVVERAFQFAQVLAFSLEDAGYFSDGVASGPRSFSARVVDISASGLLITVEDADLVARLLPGAAVDVYLSTGKRALTAGARVIRLSSESGMRFFALEFQEIKPEDLRFLYEYLYKRPFDDAAARALL